MISPARERRVISTYLLEILFRPTWPDVSTLDAKAGPSDEPIVRSRQEVPRPDRETFPGHREGIGADLAYDNAASAEAVGLACSRPAWPD
jgi:hypothetical protein